MSKFLLIIITFILTGCFTAQRDQVNKNADFNKFDLEAKCADWQSYCIQQNSQACLNRVESYCEQQFVLIEQRRHEELEDISERRRIFSQSMQNFGKRNTNCMSRIAGDRIYTDCN